MDCMCYHSPDDEGVVLMYFDGVEGFIVRNEPGAMVRRVGAKLLDGKLAVYIGSHIVAVGSFYTAVYDH